jgi:hypothetical protein
MRHLNSERTLWINELMAICSLSLYMFYVKGLFLRQANVILSQALTSLLQNVATSMVSTYPYSLGTVCTSNFVNMYLLRLCVSPSNTYFLLQISQF